MTTAAPKAIPTAYRGVTYRSRSEARLAAVLHCFKSGQNRINPDEGVLVFYEPKWLAVDDYTPDFAVLHHEESSGGKDCLAIIEYKPAMPTKAYLEFLEERFSQLCLRLTRENFAEPNCLLFIGSVFDDSSRMTLFRDSENRNWTQAPIWFYSNHDDIEYAKGYRYDLDPDSPNWE